MNYPFIKCLNPIWINNRSTGEPQLVGCGKCASCLNLRAQNLSLKCKLESKQHDYCYFITLTYDDTFVPTMISVAINGTRGRSYYFISLCSRLGENGTCITIADISKSQLDELQNKLGSPYGIPYLSVRDAQLFIKRLRKNISKYSDEKIRYFLCGEYGPKHLRPHYHLLVWFSDTEISERLDECVNQSWKFGGVRSEAVWKDASSYVANYVNSVGNIPDLYTKGKCKPFCLHSTFLGESFYRNQGKEIYKLTATEFIRRSERINDSVSEFVLWRSIKNCFYPRCRDYASLSTSERKFFYTMYAQFLGRKKTHRQPSRLAEEIIREAEELAYRLDLPYDDLRHLGKYYDELLNISRWYDYVQEAHDSYVKGITDEDQYLEAYYEYLRNWEYMKNFIYRDLAISKHFLEFVCNSTNEIEINCKVHMIEYFYRSLDLANLNDSLKHQEEMLERGELNEDELVFFYDDYDLSDLKKTPLYNIYSQNVEAMREQRQKHKKQNDANKLLFTRVGLIN